MKFPCRLDKFVSHIAELPRSQARAAIKRQHVSVNGETVTAFDAQIQQQDTIMLQDHVLKFLGKRYFMLHKPAGYVCANHDELHPTVFDLLDEPNLADFHIAGRLDIDTTGLVLITNDGDWSHKITAPKHNKLKTYLVETAEAITPQALEQLREGVLLHQEKEPTRPAQAEKLASYSLRLAISEGKYHQVKRMLAAVGNKVVALHREQVANIILDEQLQSGEYRALTAAEIKI